MFWKLDVCPQVEGCAHYRMFCSEYQTIDKARNPTILSAIYQVFRVQADWTFILQSELPAKELRHLPRKMLLCGTTY
jgi:hypothetical protein